jgi:hypothetical protein
MSASAPVMQKGVYEMAHGMGAEVRSVTHDPELVEDTINEQGSRFSKKTLAALRMA